MIFRKHRPLGYGFLKNCFFYMQLLIFFYLTITCFFLALFFLLARQFTAEKYCSKAGCAFCALTLATLLIAKGNLPILKISNPSSSSRAFSAPLFYFAPPAMVPARPSDVGDMVSSWDYYCFLCVTPKALLPMDTFSIISGPSSSSAFVRSRWPPCCFLPVFSSSTEKISVWKSKTRYPAIRAEIICSFLPYAFSFQNMPE